MSQYTENLGRAKSLVIRNHGNLIEIEASSFWITDQKQEDGTNQIKIAFYSIRNWLKLTQNQGVVCCVLPVDGPQGVFQENGLPVSTPIEYEWNNENEIQRKRAGDCDCLVLNEKWHFLEFKTDATSQDLLQITNNRNKAEAQLAKSMTSFREQLPYSDLKCICVIVGPDFFSYPKFNASSSRKISFLKKYKAELIEVSISSNASYRLD